MLSLVTVVPDLQNGNLWQDIQGWEWGQVMRENDQKTGFRSSGKFYFLHASLYSQ